MRFPLIGKKWIDFHREFTPILDLFLPNDGKRLLYILLAMPYFMLEMTHHDFAKTGSVQTNTQYGKAALKRERERETSFSLCLSRACLGKMIAFIYKLLKRDAMRVLAAEIAYALALVRKHTNGTFCAVFILEMMNILPRRARDKHTGRKRYFEKGFQHKNELFTKTGSGQTYRETKQQHSKQEYCRFLFLQGWGRTLVLPPHCGTCTVHSAQ
eukprot:COSAG06_NODE_8304_length_2206_cov_48.545066_3_plen_213_part_00